jgi:spore germination cell wall hydrolase CwlJ-like protein
MSPEEREARAAGLNGRGYEPGENDQNLLARIIFAESAGIPDDYEAIGWSIVNRIGDRRWRPTLEGVVVQPQQFDSVESDTPLWRGSATPEALDGANRRSWEHAQRISAGILRGDISDPTGGATHFFASNAYDGDPRNAPGDYQRSLRTGRMSASPYRSRSRTRRRNHFFREEARQ